MLESVKRMGFVEWGLFGRNKEKGYSKVSSWDNSSQFLWLNAFRVLWWSLDEFLGRREKRNEGKVRKQEIFRKLWYFTNFQLILNQFLNQFLPIIKQTFLKQLLKNMKKYLHTSLHFFKTKRFFYKTLQMFYCFYQNITKVVFILQNCRTVKFFSE